MIEYFAEYDPVSLRVSQCVIVEHPPEGEVLEKGRHYLPLPDPIDWAEAGTKKPHVIDGELKWIETATIEDLKTAKNEEINRDREFINTSTFMFRNKAIRCRPLDRSDIDGTNGYVALFGEFPDSWMGGWKAADNTYVAISTVDDWKAFYKAMVDCGNANFKYAQQLKSQLAAAETPEQIAAIKWETPIV